MKIRLHEPFFFEEGPRAVLLLHGFTGNSSDVRQLGRYLQKKGYTCYAPHYEGHGVPPKNCLLQVRMSGGVVCLKPMTSRMRKVILILL